MIKILKQLNITEQTLKQFYEQFRKHETFIFKKNNALNNDLPSIITAKPSVLKIEYVDNNNNFEDRQPNRIVFNGHNVILQVAIGNRKQFEIDQEVVWSSERFINE